MTSQLAHCLATQCEFNLDGLCSWERIWITEDNECATFVPVEEKEEPSFIGPVED